MKEVILWSAKPSQFLYIKRYFIFIVSGVFWMFLSKEFLNTTLFENILIKHVLLVYSLIILFIAIISILKLLTTKYELTNERLFISAGILNRLREEIELYRIKDIQVYSPFYLRLFGLSNIHLVSSDKLTPVIDLLGLKDSTVVADMLRENYEKQRILKGVREFD